MHLNILLLKSCNYLILGRGLFATKDIDIGFTILTDQPFAYALTKSQRRKRCDYCTVLNDKLKKCTACNLQFYCNAVSLRSYRGGRFILL